MSAPPVAGGPSGASTRAASGVPPFGAAAPPAGGAPRVRFAFRECLERAADAAGSGAAATPAAHAPSAMAPPGGRAASSREATSDGSDASDATDDGDGLDLRDGAPVRDHHFAGDSRAASPAVAFALPGAIHAPPLANGAGASAPVQPSPSLEHLMTALVRRVAWSGDGRRGSARLEIGAGALAGAVLVIHADEGRVRVHLDAPAGTDIAAWRERIARGLSSRSIPADEVEVT